MFKRLFYRCKAQKGFGIVQHKCYYNKVVSNLVYKDISLVKFISHNLVNPPNIINNGNNRYYNLRFKNAEKTAYLTEAEYLVKLKHDPDVFGDGKSTDDLVDEGDIQEHEFLQEKPMKSQQLSTKKYADMIKALLRKRKIKEAVDFVEIRMIKEDRVKPEGYIYNLLIGACGRVGYTKKAFSLYNDMKKRALNVTPGTYTALFNACSSSPWPTTDGLTRAKHLRHTMIEKLYEPNITNYNAMIKAFGRGGDLVTAFALVDEMSAKGHVITADTLNFLLQACISDKEAGFRHALLVWRKFIQKDISPSIFSYNLLLRCVRDCSLGDIETAKDVINRLLPYSEKVLMLEDLETQKMLASGENIENSLVTNTPNLMAKIPHLGNIISLSEIVKPEDRLLLIGGAKQFLQNMSDNNCNPDIKTFTQLLDSIPSTLAAESELFQNMKSSKVPVDIDFYNMLIKKRSMRFEYDNAKEVLGMMKAKGMRPNLITYGVLALGCKTKEEAISLLDEMSECNYRLNIEILGAMLHQACHHMNIAYVMHILELCTTQNIKPSQKFVEKLQRFRKKCKIISNDKDSQLSHSTKFQRGYKLFKTRSKTWLEEVQIDDSENVHPWQQFREHSNVDTRHYKDKEQKTRFKPVHTSLFRQKTTPNTRKKFF